MLIVMKPSATAHDVDAAVEIIQAIGLRAHPMPGATRTAIGITGNQGVIESRRFEDLPGVAEVIRVTKPYKLIMRDRESRSGVCGGGSGAEKRCPFFSRRCLEASNFTLHLSGFGRQGLGNHGGDPRNLWTEDCHGSTRRVQCRSCRTIRRRDPDRRSQYAELLASQTGRSVEAARASETRNGRDTRRVAVSGRIHYG